jgi:hypothetical protein
VRSLYISGVFLIQRFLSQVSALLSIFRKLNCFTNIHCTVLYSKEGILSVLTCLEFGPAWLQERKKEMKYENVTEQDALLKGTPAQGGLHDIYIMCHFLIFNFIFNNKFPSKLFKTVQHCRVIIIPRMLSSS